MWQVKVSHMSEMAGPFNRGDTIINKHFTFTKFIELFAKSDKMLGKPRILSLFPNLFNKT